MILEDADGWWFLAPHHTFGPYSTRDAAQRCSDNYQAFVCTAPTCHH